MNTLGLDIGGANIKAATAAGWATSVPFPLWKMPDELPSALRSIFTCHDDIDVLAVTMTGELADCFQTKAEGVEHILSAVRIAAEGRTVKVWSTAGGFIGMQEAVGDPFAVAAANWHALATWVGRRYPRRSALLIDIGSTTTDIIPLMNGLPCPQGKTDLTRLQSGELVYTGVRRTPLAAGMQIIPFRAQWATVSSELFATMLDVHLLRGDIPENSHDTDTANGRPATRTAAIDRIVRMLCADRTEITEAEAVSLAGYWADKQLKQIAWGIHQVLGRQPSPCETLFVSGSGEFLARRVVEQIPPLQSANIISLSNDFTPAIAEAACAYALACLAEAAS